MSKAVIGMSMLDSAIAKMYQYRLPYLWGKLPIWAKPI